MTDLFFFPSTYGEQFTLDTSEFDCVSRENLTHDKAKEVKFSECCQTDCSLIDEATLDTISRLKCNLERYTDDEMRLAHLRSDFSSNAAKKIFITRAGLKLAEVDHVAEHVLSQFPNPDDELHPVPPVFYFADLCSGLGSFTEYISWRRGWKSKCFCITLKSEIQFKALSGIATSECVSIYFGDLGDGDIFRLPNINSFCNKVKRETDSKGVCCVVADGALSCKLNEFRQDLSSFSLFVCEIIIALRILSVNGNFLMKVYDVYNWATCSLLFLLSCAFSRVSVLKPSSSRPANSEKYVLCCQVNEFKEDVADLLLQVFCDVYAQTPMKDVVVQFVPPELMLTFGRFLSSIQEMNARFASRQIVGLEYLNCILENPDMKVRVGEDTINCYIDDLGLPLNKKRGCPLFQYDLTSCKRIMTKKFLKWYCCRVYSKCPEGRRILVFGVGMFRVYCAEADIDANKKVKWTPGKSDGISVRLPPMTLIECHINDSVVLVTDVFNVCNDVIWKMDATTRHKYAETLCSVVNDTDDPTLSHSFVPLSCH